MPTARSTRKTGATKRGSARSQAAAAAEYEEVKSKDFAETWDFDVEPVLEGTFTGSKEVDTKHGKRTIHTFNVDGEDFDAWGASILNSRLEDVEPGTQVKVEKTGNTFPTSKGKPAQEYKVYVKRGAVSRRAA